MFSPHTLGLEWTFLTLSLFHSSSLLFNSLRSLSSSELSSGFGALSFTSSLLARILAIGFSIGVAFSAACRAFKLWRPMKDQRVLSFQLQFDKLASQLKMAKWNPEKDLLAMVTEDSKVVLHRFNWQRLWTVFLDFQTSMSKSEDSQTFVSKSVLHQKSTHSDKFQTEHK